MIEKGSWLLKPLGRRIDYTRFEYKGDNEPTNNWNKWINKVAFAARAHKLGVNAFNGSTRARCWCPHNEIREECMRLLFACQASKTIFPKSNGLQSWEVAWAYTWRLVRSHNTNYECWKQIHICFDWRSFETHVDHTTQTEEWCTRKI